MAGDDLMAATEFLRRFSSGTAKQRSRSVHKAPLGTIQTAGGRTSRPLCAARLSVLSGPLRNDQSMAVFGDALHDPVDFVRNMALHSLACEGCKTTQLCAADVVPGLIEVLESDPSVEMRTKAIPLLLRLQGNDERARAAVHELRSAILTS